MTESTLLLTALIFLPALAAIVLAFIPSENKDLIRWFTLAVTVVVFVISIMGFLSPQGASSTTFNTGIGAMQDVVNIPWIPSFNIQYFLGVDGISLPLVILTGFVTILAMGASWSITKYVKGFCILYLLLFTGMMGVFMSLDFFLFYVFWEVMLLPMYFLIGVWGGPRKEYAAIKFFLYTLVGSVLMLVAILALYFQSDVRKLAAVKEVNWKELHLGADIEAKVGRKETKNLVFVRQGAADAKPLFVTFAGGGGSVDTKYDAAGNKLAISISDKATAKEVADAVAANPELKEVVAVTLPAGADGSAVVSATDDAAELAAYSAATPVHSFNLLALAAMGQHTDLFDMRPFAGTMLADTWFDHPLQWWAFLLLFIGFIIKVPSVPLHTWLPDAHVEAPTPISMILAGVLLKMGGYGIIRICYPICPAGGYELSNLVCFLGALSMVYGGFAALAQKDFKRLVAYSSVSHMGYVLLGLGVWSARAGTNYNDFYWNMGVMGAMFQMIGHGVSSPGMFFMVGIIYDRVHHRNLDEFGGLFGKMPVYTAMALGIFFAGLGLPGLCGFIGEAVVVLSIWKYSMALAVVAAAVVIITAAYILWCLQRVYLGAEYKGPHADHLHPSTFRENLIGMTILAFCILLGVLPYQTVFKYMETTVTKQTNELTQWTEKYEAAHPPAVDTTKAAEAKPAAAPGAGG